MTLRQQVSDAASVGRQSSLSANGRFVAFVSRAPLVGIDTRPYPNVYVLDRDTGQVTLESAPPAGCHPGHACASPRLSADGRFLVFETTDDGPPGGGPPHGTIVLKDRRTG